MNDRAAEERGLWGGPTALDVPPQRADLAHLLNYRTHRHRLYGEQEGICAGSIPMFSGCNRSKGGKTMAEWLAVLHYGGQWAERWLGHNPCPVGELHKEKLYKIVKKDI